MSPREKFFLLVQLAVLTLLPLASFALSEEEFEVKFQDLKQKGIIIEITPSTASKCIEFYKAGGKDYCAIQDTDLDDRDLSSTAVEDLWKIKFDNRQWKKAWFNHYNNTKTIEYTLQNEKVEAWTELVTASKYAFPGKQVNAQLLSKALCDSGTSPSLGDKNYKIIKDTPNEVILLMNFGLPISEADLYRIIWKGGEEIYTLTYGVRGPMNQATQDKWLKLLDLSEPL